MKKLLLMKNLAILFLIISLSGCMALHTGFVSDSASLSTNNFQYKNQNIKGESNVSYFLAFGGLMSKGLVNEAMQDMKMKWPVKDNQAYANISITFKDSFHFGVLVRERRCIVSADIVEFK